MFKFSQLVLNSSISISLRNLLKNSKPFETTSFALKHTKKSNKNKTSRKLKKSTNDPMASQVYHATESVAAVSKEVNSVSPSAEAIVSIKARLNSSKNLSHDKVYTEFRQWENMEAGSNMHYGFNSSGHMFTLMSYNILAQDLLEMHSYLYHNHNQEALNWEYRLKRLSQEILALKPDILCLQEVQCTHLEMIADILNDLEFEHVFKKKTGHRTDGCAIFFNKNLFNLLEKYSVEYYQPKIEHLDRENVALIVKLCLKSDPDACFVVSTTHLLYNPRRQDVRLAQIQVLLAELDRVSVVGFYNTDEPKRLPIIVTGDFNLRPYSAPYQLITTGSLCYYNLSRNQLESPIDDYARITGYTFLPPRLGITDNCQHIDLVNSRYQGSSRLKNTEVDVDQNVIIKEYSENDDVILLEKYPTLFSTGRLTHNLNLTSAYEHRRDDGQQEASTYQGLWITVDYIFYSRHFTPRINSSCEGYLQLLARYELPTVDQCHKMGAIPNSEIGSDHLALAAKFIIQAPKS